MIEIKRLDWDSDFFGLRIGRADIVSEEESKVLANQDVTSKENFDLIYVFASHGLGFSSANAKLVDKKVEYVLSDTSQFEPNHNETISDNDRGVTDDFLHLAFVS